MSNATKIMLAMLVGLLGACSGLSMGVGTGTPEMSGLLLGMFCTVFVPLCIVGVVADLTKNKQHKTNMLARRDSLEQIAEKYNQVTELLQTSYIYEKTLPENKSFVGKEALREKFEAQYFKNMSAYKRERREWLASNSALTPTATRFKNFWIWLVAIGLIVQLATCSYSFGVAAGGEEVVAAASAEAVDELGNTLWNADNLPMPHLQDASRYVANPDGVVSENTENILNQWFKLLDDSLGIESVVAIVNHVENDDPFRMAQDLGNKYGVGKDDRGLIIILAYGDHALHFSTGKSLEGDLTDIECKRLQQQYAVPCMKAEQPDSGMLYLAEAVYNTLQNKDLPVLTERTSNADDDEMSAADGHVLIYFLLFGGWLMLIAWIYSRYNSSPGGNMFLANPFMKQPTGSSAFIGGGGFGGHSSGHHGGFSGGGGGFSGGSFGGGSFGGGGATSRW